jgi:hypothetical protein
MRIGAQGTEKRKKRGWAVQVFWATSRGHSIKVCMGVNGGCSKDRRGDRECEFFRNCAGGLCASALIRKRGVEI